MRVGIPDPLTRGGASVQLYIGTVIEYPRKNCENINFVVEVDDIGNSFASGLMEEGEGFSLGYRSLLLHNTKS